MAEALLTAFDKITREPFQLLGDSETGTLLPGNAVVQAIPDSEDPTVLGAQWGGFAGINWAGGDFVTSVSGLNGQSITVLSASPLTTGESFAVNTNKGVPQPAAMEFAGSFVRTGQSFATASLFANGPTGADTVPEPINIVSCYQSNAVQGAAYSAVAGTVMHMTLSSPLPAVGANNAVFIGDWINITGLDDNRLNYQNACINYISPDRLVIAVGFSDEAALPSLAVPVITPTLGTAKANFYNNMSGARNGFGLRLTGTTPTSGAIVSVFGGDDNQVSGSLLGDHRVTIGTSAPTYVAGGNFGQYEIRSSTRYLLQSSPGESVIMDKAEQTQQAWAPRDIPRTSVKPSSESILYPRFRLFKPISISRPIAKIVSAVKSGTTTATVTTDVPHGLVTNNWVTVKGARDVTNFAPLTTPVQVTVTGANTFTLVWGAAVTATSYGGSVIIANGGKDQPGIVGQTIQSVASRVANGGNWLDVVGSSAWTILNLGDYVDIHGVRSAVDGSDLGLDGAWEVAHIATTTLTLKPIFNIAGVRVSPALGTLVSTNCGGSMIFRPTLRSHDLSISSWSEGVTKIDGQGTSRVDRAVPVQLVVTPLVAQSGTWNVGLNAGTNTIGTVNSQLIPNTLVADVASAAITTTTTTAAITPTWGKSYQVNIPVTAVTGTNPTLDIRIEESDDNGTNWYTVYDFTRITTTGIYRSPVIPLIGNRIRYVQTVGGTSPSFTRAVNRNQSNYNALPQRQLVDRSIVLTTLNSVTPVIITRDCGNASQLVINVGAITTTAPALQLEGSDDFGLTWYAIGTPLTAVASSTVQVTVTNINSAVLRARVSTAGVGVTAGYVMIKAHD